jgi:hypothetical protein
VAAQLAASQDGLSLHEYSNSRYSRHIINMGHAYGSITDVMKVIKIEEGGKTPKYTGNIPCV